MTAEVWVVTYDIYDGDMEAETFSTQEKAERTALEWLQEWAHEYFGSDELAVFEAAVQKGFAPALETYGAIAHRVVGRNALTIERR